jgi:hypothetical protein
MQNISHTVPFGENMYGYCVCLEYVQKKSRMRQIKEAADKAEWKKSIGIQFIYFLSSQLFTFFMWLISCIRWKTAFLCIWVVYECCLHIFFSLPLHVSFFSLCWQNNWYEISLSFILFSLSLLLIDLPPHPHPRVVISVALCVEFAWNVQESTCYCFSLFFMRFILQH